MSAVNFIKKVERKIAFLSSKGALYIYYLNDKVSDLAQHSAWFMWKIVLYAYYLNDKGS